MRAEGYVLHGSTLYAPGDELPGDEQADEVQSTETVSPWAKTAKAELLKEIEKRNADREDDAKIAPASEKVGDLREALDADDALLASES